MSSVTPLLQSFGGVAAVKELGLRPWSFGSFAPPAGFAYARVRPSQIPGAVTPAAYSMLTQEQANMSAGAQQLQTAAAQQLLPH